MPLVSVVVVSFNSEEILDQCLRALTLQAKAPDFEILVVTRRKSAGARLAARYPEAVWSFAPEASTVPQMRRAGVERSRGGITALLEDDCVVGPGWCESLIRAHRHADAVIGGPVEPGNYRRSADWAVFLSDYARFIPPFEGKVPALCGNNVSYRRTTLERVLGEVRDMDGFYEVFVHWKLRQTGLDLIAEPDLTVRNINSWTKAYVTSVPFHHARNFAAMRASGYSLARRLLYCGMTPVLPLVRMGRIASEVLRRGTYTGQFVGALPWIAVSAVFWASGEAVGYAFGPGDSATRWR